MVLDLERYKMKKNIFIFLVFIIAGCSYFKPEESTVTQPKLLKQSALPTLTQSTFNDKYEFICEMLVNTNGDVERAKLLNSSGDETWDSLAVQSLLKWKYSPAMLKDHPIKMLVRSKIIVLFSQPIIISLAEIELKNLSQADSVYNALISGADFTELVLKYSISSSRNNKGFLGEVNVKLFSKNISTVLVELDEDEFTKPLGYGDHFIIFKRLK